MSETKDQAFLRIAKEVLNLGASLRDLTVEMGGDPVELDKIQEDTLGVIKKFSETKPPAHPDTINPVVGQCSKCQRELRKCEHRHCADPDCPLQTKVIC